MRHDQIYIFKRHFYTLHFKKPPCWLLLLENTWEELGVEAGRQSEGGDDEVGRGGHICFPNKQCLSYPYAFAHAVPSSHNAIPIISI